MGTATEQGGERRYGLMTLSGNVQEVDGRMVALCRELPVSGVGHDTEEAFASLLDACRVYLNAIERSGDAQGLLPPPSAGEAPRFRIPYRFEPSRGPGLAAV